MQKQYKQQNDSNNNIDVRKKLMKKIEITAKRKTIAFINKMRRTTKKTRTHKNNDQNKNSYNNNNKENSNNNDNNNK